MCISLCGVCHNESLELSVYILWYFYIFECLKKTPENLSGSVRLFFQVSFFVCKK